MPQRLAKHFQWIRAKLDAGRKRFAKGSLLCNFDESVEKLAPEFDVQRSRRVAEKVINSNAPGPICLIAGFFLMGELTGKWSIILNQVAQIEHASGNVHAANTLHRYATLYEKSSPSLPVAIGVLPVILAFLLSVVGYSFWRYHSSFIVYNINRHIIDAVICCARLQEQDESKIASTVRQLDRSCRVIEKKILAAHRYRRTITRHSPRHAPAGVHASRVAGALRNQLSELDSDIPTGSKGLALMLLEIGDQYAKGAIGRLLSEEALSDVQPVSRAREALRESLHISFVVTVMLGAALLANALVPKDLVGQDMRPLLLTSSAIVAGTITGGWNRVARLLGVLPGK